MIIKIIKVMFVFVTGVFFIELIFKSNPFSTLRINFTYWQIQIETKCVMIMEKYKFLYRVMIEMFIIWFVFEWNNKMVISYILNLFALVDKKIKPMSLRAKDFFIFLSPYGRKVMGNEIVFKWMYIFSVGLIIILALLFISALLSSKERIYKIFTNLIAGFIAWYALLLAAIIISKIPQNHIFICWGLAIFLFGLIQITMVGILSE